MPILNMTPSFGGKSLGVQIYSAATTDVPSAIEGIGYLNDFKSVINQNDGIYFTCNVGNEEIPEVLIYGSAEYDDEGNLNFISSFQDDMNSFFVPTFNGGDYSKIISMSKYSTLQEALQNANPGNYQPYVYSNFSGWIDGEISVPDSVDIIIPRAVILQNINFEGGCYLGSVIGFSAGGITLNEGTLSNIVNIQCYYLTNGLTAVDSTINSINVILNGASGTIDLNSNPSYISILTGQSPLNSGPYTFINYENSILSLADTEIIANEKTSLTAANVNWNTSNLYCQKLGNGLARIVGNIGSNSNGNTGDIALFPEGFRPKTDILTEVCTGSLTGASPNYLIIAKTDITQGDYGVLQTTATFSSDGEFVINCTYLLDPNQTANS